MRADQYVGLNSRAIAWLKEHAKQARYITTTIVVHEDGHEQKLPPHISEGFVTNDYDVISGAWTDKVADLLEYSLKDGRYAKEYVQATPWSDGPMYYIALEIKDEPVPETLWTDKEIENEGELTSLEDQIPVGT